jgi:hypothetical protein
MIHLVFYWIRARYMSYSLIHTALIIETNSLAAELAFLAKAALDINMNLASSLALQQTVSPARRLYVEGDDLCA